MLVSVLRGNIFGGGTDLTVLPCSAKPSVSKITKNWIELFELVDPLKFRYSLVHGGISRVYNFKHNSKRTKKYVYAGAVLNDYSTPDIVFHISKLLGKLTHESESIRQIETPLLGTGAGGLSNIDSVVALAAGFQETAHPDARLIVYCFNENVVKEVRTVVEGSSVERLAEKIKLSPSIFGIGVDLNEPKMKLAKAISKLRF